MAIVNYNGNAIIPAPLVAFVDEPIIAGNQTRVGTNYRLTINGKLISYMGSPASAPYGGGMANGSWGGYNNQYWIDTAYPPNETNPTFSYHQLYMMESKQAALQNLFSQDGLWLEFQSPDGSTPFRCLPRNAQVSFAEGTWFTECDYTITLETDAIYLNGQILQGLPFPTGTIQSCSESWNISPGDIVKTFSAQHTVSAVGKRTFDGNGHEFVAWTNAQNFVNNQLVLGWSGASAYSNYTGGNIFQNSSLASGVLNFSQYTPYNYSQTQVTDELAGSYEVTETWMLSPTTSGSQTYVVNTRRIVDDPYCTVVSQVQGTIRGYYDGLFNYDQRIAAAEYYFTSLGGTTGLLNLVLATNSGYTYNIQPRQGSLDYNVNEGTIGYAYEFSNQLYENDAFETYAISRKTSVNDYISTFGINGSVKGRRYDGDTNVLASFTRAYAWYSSLTGNNYVTFYNRVLSNTYFPEAAGMNLRTAPISISVDFNQGEGLVSYAFEFNNRLNLDTSSGNTSNNVKEEFQISKRFSVDDGISTYTIAGTIEGLNVVDTNPQQAKFSAASGYFANLVTTNSLYNRVSNYYSISLPNPNALSTEITYMPVVGTISYSYEFRNTFPPILSGVLSENINVSEHNYSEQINLIGQIPIIGRAHGAILQDMATTDIKTRTLTIEAVLSPTGGIDLLSSFNTKPNYDAYAIQLKPINGYCTNWNDSYSWKTGHYSLNIDWLYQ